MAEFAPNQSQTKQQQKESTALRNIDLRGVGERRSNCNCVISMLTTKISAEQK